MVAALGRLLCFLGWHRPKILWRGTVNTEAVCRRCGRRGLLDSNGDLF